MKKFKSFAVLFLAGGMLVGCGNNTLGKELTDWTDYQKNTMTNLLGADNILPFMFLPATDVFGTTATVYAPEGDGTALSLDVVLVRAPEGKAKNVTDYVEIALKDEDFGLRQLSTPELSDLLIQHFIPIDNGYGVPEDEKGELPFVLLDTESQPKFTLKKELSETISLLVIVGLVYMESAAGATAEGYTEPTNLNFAIVAAVMDNSLIPSFEGIFDDILNDAGWGSGTPISGDDAGSIDDYLTGGTDLDQDDIDTIEENMPPSIFPDPEVSVDDEGYSIVNVVPDEYQEEVDELIADYGSNQALLDEAEKIIIDKAAEVLAESNYIRLGTLPSNAERPYKQEVFYLTLPSGKYSLCYVRVEIEHVRLVSDYRIATSLPTEADGLIPYVAP